MQRKSTLAVMAFSAVMAVSSSQAAELWANPITGTNPNTANPYTAGQTVIPNITVSGIGRGAGIVGANAGNRYNAESWNTATLDPTAYFTFTLTPSPGFTINFENFVYTGQASGSGPTSFAFRSSVDSFAANIGTPTAAGATIVLGAPSYQGVSTPIEFRFYGWGTTQVGGTFSINDFTFNGEVIPEPSGALLGALGLLGLLRRRRLG